MKCLKNIFYLFFYSNRRATFVKSKAVRAKQPLEPAWPVTNTAAAKLFTSHGKSKDVFYAYNKR